VIEAAPDMMQRPVMQTMGILSSLNTDLSDRMSTTVESAALNNHHITITTCMNVTTFTRIRNLGSRG